MKPMKPKPGPKAKLKSIKKSFKATLERLRSNLGWVVIWIPFKVHKVWGSRGRLKIRGEINGFPFRTSLFPTRKGEHFLLVNKKMQEGANAVEGSTAEFLLEPDTEERIVVVPAELKNILAEDKTFKKWFESLNYSIRKWLADWITQPRSAASRVRRAEQVAEQLLSTMEAERELPPALKLAFTRDPRALEGWNIMSPADRHLLLPLARSSRPPHRESSRRSHRPRGKTIQQLNSRQAPPTSKPPHPFSRTAHLASLLRQRRQSPLQSSRPSPAEFHRRQRVLKRFRRPLEERRRARLLDRHVRTS